MSAPHTCWYTGIEVKRGPHNGSDMAVETIEHIVPFDSHLYKALGALGALERRNKVPACGFVNWHLGSSPLAVKFAVRDRLRFELYGTTDLRQVVARASWSKRLRARISAAVNEEGGRYRLLGKRVYHDPIVAPLRGIRMWSLDNPHLPITPEILAERELRLALLRVRSLRRVQERFGVEITPELRAAHEQDLYRQHGPRPGEA